MLYYIMSDTTNHSINYNNEDHNTYEDTDELFNVKRISIPINKVLDFIKLIYGDQEIMIMNATMRDNYLDLTSRSVIVL